MGAYLRAHRARLGNNSRFRTPESGKPSRPHRSSLRFTMPVRLRNRLPMHHIASSCARGLPVALHRSARGAGLGRRNGFRPTAGQPKRVGTGGHRGARGRCTWNTRARATGGQDRESRRRTGSRLHHRCLGRLDHQGRRVHVRTRSITNSPHSYGYKPHAPTARHVTHGGSPWRITTST